MSYGQTIKIKLSKQCCENFDTKTQYIIKSATDLSLLFNELCCWV